MGVRKNLLRTTAFCMISAVELILWIMALFKRRYRYSYLETDAYGHLISDGLDLLRRHKIIGQLYGKTMGKPFILIYPVKVCDPTFISILSKHFRIIQMAKWPISIGLKWHIKEILYKRKPVDYDYLCSFKKKAYMKSYIPAGRMMSSRDELGLWEKYPIHISYLLSEDEINECKTFLLSNRVDPNKFISVHVRSSNWYKSYNSDIADVEISEENSLRNSLDASTFRKGCLYALQKGYSVVQMGKLHPRINIDHPNFFFVGDCECPPFLDIYLLASGLGMIGTGCGPDSSPVHFGNPMCIFNQHPLLYAYSYGKCLINPPILRDKLSGEVLSLGNYIKNHTTMVNELEENNITLEIPNEEQIMRTIAFFIDYYIESQNITPTAFSRSWKLFNSNYVTSLLLLRDHYFNNISYYNSIYNAVRTSNQPPPSQEHLWPYYVNKKFLISPEFFKIVGEEWLDIRM